MDSHPIQLQLKRLANDPSMDMRHRRVIQETLRVFTIMEEELREFKNVEALFETNERLQKVLAEEMEKQA